MNRTKCDVRPRMIFNRRRFVIRSILCWKIFFFYSFNNILMCLSQNCIIVHNVCLIRQVWSLNIWLFDDPNIYSFSSALLKRNKRAPNHFPSGECSISWCQSLNNEKKRDFFFHSLIVTWLQCRKRKLK